MHLLYPHLITNRQLVDTIHTHDGNQLYFLRVSNDAIDNGDEPQVLYTSLHHAREANSISQIVFYLWYLLENYDKDPIVKSIVEDMNGQYSVSNDESLGGAKFNFVIPI